MLDRDEYKVPLLTIELAEYLKEQFSADRQISLGLLSDPAVVRSEGYLLGFLAGLGYSRQVLDSILDSQAAVSEESDTMTRQPFSYNIGDSDNVLF